MNCIAVILFTAFPVLTAGNKLDLSWRGLTMEEFFLDSNGSVMSQVEKATELNLRGNLFDGFVDSGVKLDKLKILDLSKNKLTRFYFTCDEKNNLSKLNVSHNKLPFLNVTSFTKRISKLEILDLSFNVIQFLRRTTFQHLENLKFLSLTGNPIKTNIEPGLFQNLTSLTVLNLSNISAPGFPRDLFVTLTNLRHINLALNPLEDIPALPTGLLSLDISGTNIIYLMKIDYPHLHKLTMNSMPLLDSLDLSHLGKVRSLAVLSIENCRLKKITAEGKSGAILPQIKHISIKNCSVDKLGDDVVSVMKKTTKLNLQENPWQCDCSLNWIFTMKSMNSHHDHIRCGSPAALRHQRVFEIPREEFECSKINYSALFLSLGIILLLGILIALLYFARESIFKLWRSNYKRGDTVMYEHITRKSNAEGEKILDQCDITD